MSLGVGSITASSVKAADNSEGQVLLLVVGCSLVAEDVRIKSILGAGFFIFFRKYPGFQKKNVKTKCVNPRGWKASKY